MAQRVQMSIPRITWAGDRLLYGAFVGGKPSILRTSAGATTSEVVLGDGLTPAATRDGGTIVFVSPRLDLWTADASGRRLTQLVAGVSAAQVIVTPDDRDVLFTRVEEWSRYGPSRWLGARPPGWWKAPTRRRSRQMDERLRSSLGDQGTSLAAPGLWSARLHFIANDRRRDK